MVVIVLIGVGIWLIIANHSSAQVIAGLGTIVGGLGIT
jgi:multisubunit Na+/H+ antiporter MnhC subunit